MFQQLRAENTSTTNFILSSQVIINQRSISTPHGFPMVCCRLGHPWEAPEDGVRHALRQNVQGRGDVVDAFHAGNGQLLQVWQGQKLEGVLGIQNLISDIIWWLWLKFHWKSLFFKPIGDRCNLVVSDVFICLYCFINLDPSPWFSINHVTLKPPKPIDDVILYYVCIIYDVNHG